MNILISADEKADPVNYVRAVQRAGGRASAVYLPRFGPEWDGLVLAGGGDMDPALFGQEDRGSRNVDRRRDEAELALLDGFLGAGKPVLAICRGHQVANVWAGGSLIQDLGRRNRLHQWEGEDKIHLLMPVSGFLRLTCGRGPFPVNSAHHQAVGRVGTGLRVCARAEDGVVEAMEHCALPLITVQFHPERMSGPDTVDGGAIFRHFLALCRCNSGCRRI